MEGKLGSLAVRVETSGHVTENIPIITKYKFILHKIISQEITDYSNYQMEPLRVAYDQDPGRNLPGMALHGTIPTPCLNLSNTSLDEQEEILSIFPRAFLMTLSTL